MLQATAATIARHNNNKSMRCQKENRQEIIGEKCEKKKREEEGERSRDSKRSSRSA